MVTAMDRESLIKPYFSIGMIYQDADKTSRDDWQLTMILGCCGVNCLQYTNIEDAINVIDRQLEGQEVAPLWRKNNHSTSQSVIN